jgi:SAM-dependent methyltransferase
MNPDPGLTERYYPESRFGGFTRVDGTIPFFTRVQALAKADMVVLDVGCGRGAAADRFDERPWERCRVLKGKCKHVIGIDVDPVGQTNPLIDEFRRIDGDRWPVDDASIDLLVSDAVLEHIPNPDQYFAECRRVVKPGGYICIRTPNRWSYVSIGARLVPNRLHGSFVEKIQPGRQAKDVFPTFYRANTLGALRRQLVRHGFDGYAYRHISEPSHLRFSRAAYAMGVWLHRWLPGFMWPWIFLFARRL